MFYLFSCTELFFQTYCVDSQVADSACSATAYLGGVKANIGTIGVTARVKVDDCAGMNNATNQVTSILKWSQVKIICSNERIISEDKKKFDKFQVPQCET